MVTAELAKKSKDSSWQQYKKQAWYTSPNIAACLSAPYIAQHRHAGVGLITRRCHYGNRWHAPAQAATDHPGMGRTA